MSLRIAHNIYRGIEKWYQKKWKTDFASSVNHFRISGKRNSAGSEAAKYRNTSIIIHLVISIKKIFSRFRSSHYIETT